MTEIEAKYGFPLFTRNSNNVYLGNNKKLIIADIWSFWDYLIKKNNYNKDFMSSLLEQARNFYTAAESSPLKSKPLLYYYSFLNFAKIVINMDNRYGRTSYMHGLSESHLNRFSHSTVTIKARKITTKNVAAELIEVLDGTPITVDTVINIKEHLTHCVGIHRTYGEIYNMSEIFFRLKDHKIFKDGKKIIFKTKIICTSLESTSLIAQGYNIILEDGVYYWQEDFVTQTYNPTRNDYFQLSSILRRKGIWYFLNNDGYRLYISNNSTQRYSPEAIIYNTMFFLGSITRYHPYMFDSIFQIRSNGL